MGLAFLSNLLVGRDGHDSVVDRPEVANKTRIGEAQPDLWRRPGPVGRLGAQQLTDGIADRQQRADDFRRRGREAVAALAQPDCDDNTATVDDESRIARTLSRARAGQPQASDRSLVRWKSRAWAATLPAGAGAASVSSWSSSLAVTDTGMAAWVASGVLRVQPRAASWNRPRLNARRLA
jgi:hypothetical protein